MEFKKILEISFLSNEANFMKIKNNFGYMNNIYNFRFNNYLI